MNVKQHEILLELLKLEALNRRLFINHSMKFNVQTDIKNMKSGMKGEAEVDYPLSFLDEHTYLILHNLRIPDQQGFFQIDTLILTKKFILILEVKNWYGTVVFGENGQVSRIGDNHKEEGFKNPVPQANLQRHRLQKWLHSQGFPKIPIDFFVVISFPSTIIKSAITENMIPSEIIHNSELFFKIEEKNRNYSTSCLEADRLVALSKRLIASHTPANINILAHYNISKNELIKGVFCPQCGNIPMTRVKRKWDCNICSHRSVKAHLPALNDYKLLIGPKISNQNAREFMQINSPDVVRRLLKKENLNFFGRTNTRLYELK